MKFMKISEYWFRNSLKGCFSPPPLLLLPASFSEQTIIKSLWYLIDRPSWLLQKKKKSSAKSSNEALDAKRKRFDDGLRARQPL